MTIENIPARLADHPTVRRVRSRKTEKPGVIDADWLRQVCLDAGADDVAVASVWMAFLLGFAGKEEEMDRRIGADRKTIDALRDKVEQFEAKTARPTSLSDLLSILAIAFVATWIGTSLSKVLPSIGSIVRGFTWVVITVTTIGVGLSFTR
ncbi:MAG: DUF819 family protein, partial [Acidobacteria bacterium]|nr:DUF819 family protein [Acidobacteriota bacterium]